MVAILDKEFQQGEISKTKILDEDNPCDLNNLINNHKFKRIYICKFKNKMRNCIMTYNLTKTNNEIDESFLR